MQVQALVSTGLSIPTSPEGTPRPHEEAFPLQPFSSGGTFWHGFLGMLWAFPGARRTEVPPQKPCRCCRWGQALLLPRCEGEAARRDEHSCQGQAGCSRWVGPGEEGPFQEEVDASGGSLPLMRLPLRPAR